MEIAESSLNQTLVLALTGRLDGLASPTLEKKVEEVLSAGTKKLAVDCSKLEYVSSAGLRVFLSTAKKFKAAGGKATYAALTPPVLEVFELSGFLAVLNVTPTVAAAVA